MFLFLCLCVCQLNVILVSSEHAFPFKLMNPNLSFNINDFNAFIFAGEVSPKDMYQLLTSKWGVEDSLALALIDHYGGHVWDVYLALKRLLGDKQRFKALDSSLSDSVIQCLNWKGDREGDPERMRETLRLLAVTGFCPIKTMLPFSHDIDIVRTMPSLLRDEYQSQSPFPHIHIHDFFDESLISKAANEFPNFTNSTFDVSLLYLCF